MRAVRALVVCAAVALLSALSADAETFHVSVRNPDGGTSSTILQTGQPYSLVLSGGFCFWPASDWDHYPENCGTPGSYAGDSLTSHDAEFQFARPNPDNCPPLPGHRDRIRFSFGEGLQHYCPVGGVPDGPSPGGTYEYLIVGLGQSIQIRLDTDCTWGDNYGNLTATLELSTHVSEQPLPRTWSTVKRLYSE